MDEMLRQFFQDHGTAFLIGFGVAMFVVLVIALTQAERHYAKSEIACVLRETRRVLVNHSESEYGDGAHEAVKTVAGLLDIKQEEIE